MKKDTAYSIRKKIGKLADEQRDAYCDASDAECYGDDLGRKIVRLKKRLKKMK